MDDAGPWGGRFAPLLRPLRADPGISDRSPVIDPALCIRLAIDQKIVQRRGRADRFPLSNAFRMNRHKTRSRHRSDLQLSRISGPRYRSTSSALQAIITSAPRFALSRRKSSCADDAFPSNLIVFLLASIHIGALTSM